MSRVTYSVALLALAPPRSGRQARNKEDPLVAGRKFVRVPKGTFWMGWDTAQKQGKQVTIEQDFQLAAYTVTQEQWEAVMGNNPSFFSRQGRSSELVKDILDADLKWFPVETVSWDLRGGRHAYVR
jgi:formylglycine-generating enzyme required for sulfatase activity